MKQAIFKKTYVTETTFNADDLILFINDAFKGTNSNFVDKKQVEDIRDSSDLSLLETLKTGNYRLEYLGLDKLNTYHLFNITNGVNTIEIIMKDDLFRTNFEVV